jgi:hypothetical protein
MTPQKLTALVMVTAAALATFQALAAGQANFDLEPEFRAKIAKEKAKQKAATASNFSFANRGANNAGTECGSQNIGNVETGGRIGTAPREIFVFAPNAINLVNGNGCR